MNHSILASSSSRTEPFSAPAWRDFLALIDSHKRCICLLFRHQTQKRRFWHCRPVPSIHNVGPGKSSFSQASLWSWSSLHAAAAIHIHTLLLVYLLMPRLCLTSVVINPSTLLFFSSLLDVSMDAKGSIGLPHAYIKRWIPFNFPLLLLLERLDWCHLEHCLSGCRPAGLVCLVYVVCFLPLSIDKTNPPNPGPAVFSEIFGPHLVHAGLADQISLVHNSCRILRRFNPHFYVAELIRSESSTTLPPWTSLPSQKTLFLQLMMMMNSAGLPV